MGIRIERWPGRMLAPIELVLGRLRTSCCITAQAPPCVCFVIVMLAIGIHLLYSSVRFAQYMGSAGRVSAQRQ